MFCVRFLVRNVLSGGSKDCPKSYKLSETFFHMHKYTILPSNHIALQINILHNVGYSLIKLKFSLVLARPFSYLGKKDGTDFGTVTVKRDTFWVVEGYFVTESKTLVPLKLYTNEIVWISYFKNLKLWSAWKEFFEFDKEFDRQK